MGWWGADVVVGDQPLDRLGLAANDILDGFNETLGRRPTRDEWGELFSAALAAAGGDLLVRVELTFDAGLIRDVLRSQPVALRLAFAAACAERLLSGCEARTPTIGEPWDALRAALAEVWNVAEGRDSAEEATLQTHSARCAGAIPPDQLPWTVELSYLTFAGNCVRNAVQAAIGGPVESAVGAARVPFDAIEYWCWGDYETTIAGDMKESMRRTLQLAEMTRQRRDLELVAELATAGERDRWRELRERARAEGAVVWRNR
ncbi:MAG: hypothetical protein IT379_13250 [Deltaproteobacteria bacterium]|nr:hypothetical protein [Deltaproteobacteria bacterium]